ncbi:NFX1-type zinc finger-containing protein 1-like [Epargyreus clarus]|uniref:NFX1-type zinc finger-containing protein 1-like n=1 Tax=Epargyreus clarus TaxID=520877 RepID=UPI003C2DCE85
MSESNKPSLRIDWFDGTVMEDFGQASTANFADEDVAKSEPEAKPKEIEKKPIGFKRLLDLSLLSSPLLNLEIANRPGFWLLLDGELKGDFIVLIVKVLANVYKSLQPGEKSKIVTMLRTRFEKSQFVNILKDYIIGLPKVRIVEKKMNLQLWNDIETFFFDVLELCSGIFKFGINNSGYLHDLNDLIEATEASALGVQKEHSEMISEAFFSQIRQLKYNVVNCLQTNKQVEQTKYKNTDPNSFRNLHIFPKKDDLIRNAVEIKPNIINGAYPSIEDYLDLQFKLLREDCYGPLREGICNYLENPSQKRHENLRIYPKVRIIRTYVANNKVGHLVDVAWNERVQNLPIDKKHANKRLMFGSLLLFTSDNFQTILCASVLDSSSSLLSMGYIAVSFENPVSSKVFSEAYLMVESEVFFEPYHRVLKVLQNSEIDSLPMKKYIVDVQTKTEAPVYLSSETIYSINDSKKSDEIYFPVLDTSQWPLAEYFGLDQSQMEAYMLALTREFAVIQGPPGTGKTYIGTKIASTLLKNLSLEGTPMLIICYTNHALDQFLEGILNVTTNIIRLGSQSKSKIIEPYTLNNVRMKVKSKFSHLYAKKRKELGDIFKQMTDVQNEIEKCETQLLSYKSIRPHLKVNDKLFELKCDKEDAVLHWLFEHLENRLDNPNEDVSEDLDDWEKQCDDMEYCDINDKIETCFSEEYALKEIDSMNNSIKYINDITDDNMESKMMRDKFEAQIDKVKKRLEYFKKHILLTRSTKDYSIDPNIKKVYDLSSENRWKVYSNAVGKVKDELTNKMNDLLEQHNICSKELEEVSNVIDSEIMKTARVVGVTTTVAARRHELLKKLLSSIVIVEEAAEVLEAHIIASLTNYCQHLILIGDHKQLRPTAAHYKLAKDYNLEISLFERMIRNGIHARTLSTQRRMRPNFVELLVPAVYEKLDCHPTVFTYPDVRGMKDSLYFYSHNVFEDSEGLEDSWSHKNTYEAKWCVSLANYLRNMKYASQDIVILSTYTGQATLIKELSKKYSSLEEVKITVVDNYQGEESRIVILSLVRSNRDGKIGFLTAANRICVALSRAREGFYIFGNMNVLQSSSPIWRCINKKLIDQNAIGQSLALRCEKHMKTLNVSSTEDLDNIKAGACLKACSVEQ